jgi:hypothetical protein
VIGAQQTLGVVSCLALASFRCEGPSSTSRFPATLCLLERRRAFILATLFSRSRARVLRELLQRGLWYIVTGIVFLLRTGIGTG